MIINIIYNYLKKKINSPTLQLLLAGILTTLAFAPFDLIFLLIISFYLLLNNIYRQNLKIAFYRGFIFGFTHFLTSLYWLGIALTANVGNFEWLIPFALILIPAGLGIYSGITCAIASTFKHSRILFCIGFCLTWSIVEIIRGCVPVPFPWNFMGYTLSCSSSLLMLAPKLGVHLSSLLVLLISTICFSRKWILCAFTYIILVLLVLILNINKDEVKFSSTVVRVVQPNIVDHHLGNSDKQYEALNTMIKLSIKNPPANLKAIIWPEAAYPYLYKNSINEILALRKLAPIDGYLIMGADRVDTNHKIFNSIIAINNTSDLATDAAAISLYDKRILVPFGEYVPLRKVLWFINKIVYGMGEFEAGKDYQLFNTQSNTLKFLPLICYEILFPIHEDLDNYEWILNVTNDSWFGNSIGPYQHLAMVKFKAAEYGMPLVRSANSGVSAIISPYGAVITHLNLSSQGIIDYQIPQKIFIRNNAFKKYQITILIISFLICISLNLALRINTKFVSRQYE